MSDQLINIFAGGSIAAFTSILTLLIQSIFERRRRHEEWEHDRQSAIDADARERRKALQAAEDERTAVYQRYRYPLFRAAFDLQSRLYNIVKGGGRHLFQSAEHTTYMVDSTLFLLCQYFAWIEIVRHQGDRFVLDKPEQIERFQRTLAELENEFNALDQRNPLRVFRLQQRELGEMIIVDTPQGETCLSYSRFSELLGDAKRSAGTLQDLHARIKQLNDLSGESPYLRRMQNGLIDLIDLLDPPGPNQAYPGLREKV